MSNQDLLKRLALIKAKPELAQMLPQEQLISMMADFVTAFQALQKAIETNKLKGDKGDDGYTPTPGKDYPSYDEIDSVLTTSLQQYATEYKKFQEKANAVIAKASELKDGKNAEITEELKEEIASIASSLIELPDFDSLVSTEITRNGEAIRDALELLVGDARYQVELTDVKGLENVLRELSQIRGSSNGGIGKNQVYGFIREAVADGTIPSGGAGAVDSVNGQTGGVVLEAGDVGAYTEAEVDTLLTGKANTSHTHVIADTTGLQTALDGKQPLATVLTNTTASFTTAQETKLAGIAAGAEVNVNADWNAVSGDAQILNKPTISGTNTGDQTSIVGITGTKAQFDTAVTDGNFMYVGDAPTAHTHTLADVTDVTMTVANLNSLDDGVNSTLHFHNTDRDRANHTGTQTASTISDFTTAAQTVAPAETTSTVGSLVNGSTATTTPADTDRFALSISGVLRHVTWANIKATLLTYFNTIYLPLTGGTVTGDLSVSRSQASGYVVHTVGNTDPSGRAEVALLTDEGAFAGFIAMGGSTASGVPGLDIGTSVARPVRFWAGTGISPRAELDPTTGEMQFFHDVVIPYEAYDSVAWATSPKAVTQQAFRDVINSLPGAGAFTSSQLAPAGDQSLTAGYSAYFSDYYEIESTFSLEIGEEAVFEIG